MRRCELSGVDHAREGDRSAAGARGVGAAAVNDSRGYQGSPLAIAALRPQALVSCASRKTRQGSCDAHDDGEVERSCSCDSRKFRRSRPAATEDPQPLESHPADAASALLGLRRDGVERVAELAELTGISLEDAERLLCLGVAVLAKWGYGEAALCSEYRLTPEQVAQAIRRCPAELLAESV